MSCYDKCGYDEVTRERVSELEARERLYVQTVNGVYGPFVTLPIPDVDSLTIQVGENTEDIIALESSSIDHGARLDTIEESYIKAPQDYEGSATGIFRRDLMEDGVTVVRKAFPIVSETKMGAMTPEAYLLLEQCDQRLDAMEAGSTAFPAVDLLTATPTQGQLTTAFEASQGRLPGNYDRILNTFENNNTVYLWATSAWYVIAGGSVPKATLTTLGTVMGSESDGKAYVEADGTLSVNGWDATQEAILDKVDKVPAIHTYRKVYCIDSIEGNNEISIVVDNPETCGHNNIPTRTWSGNIVLPSLSQIDQPYYAVRKDYVDRKIKSASNITILNTNWVANVDSADLHALGYVYQYTIPVTGMLATMIPTVIPDYATYVSGVLWGMCQSVTGGVTIYSKTNITMTILSVYGVVI